jgi:hypothetical protein
VTEHIASFWDAMAQFLTSKITNTVLASTLIVSAENSKPEPFINLADYGLLSLSIPSWMQIVGSLWILTLLLEKIGLFKLIAWLWRRISARRD